MPARLLILVCVLILNTAAPALQSLGDKSAAGQEPAPPAAAHPDPPTPPAGKSPAEQPKPPQPKPEPPKNERALTRQAWRLLLSGTKDPRTAKRATAVRVLSLLQGQPKAIALVQDALDDDKYPVRVAGALALGELHATSSIPKLRLALSDKEPVVVLAAAHSLVQMQDPDAYEVYYEILTGERRSGKGLIAGQLDILKDPKKMAMLGFQEGIGFVPFAGIGYAAIRTIMKDDSSPVRAAAAKVLADDKDSTTNEGLVHVALDDKHELVRTAALDALARRGDTSVIAEISAAMADPKDPVKYTAAAAVLHLTQIESHRNSRKKNNQDASAAAPRTGRE